MYSCTHWLRTRNSPHPPAFGLIDEGAIGQPRETTSLCNPLGQSDLRDWRREVGRGPGRDFCPCWLLQCRSCAECSRKVGGTPFPLSSVQALLTPIKERGWGEVQSSTVSEASFDETASAYHLWRLTKPQCRLLIRAFRLRVARE